MVRHSAFSDGLLSPSCGLQSVSWSRELFQSSGLVGVEGLCHILSAALLSPSVHGKVHYVGVGGGDAMMAVCDCHMGLPSYVTAALWCTGHI